MTDQQSPVTAEALAAKWSGLLNQAFISIITLESAIAQRDAIIAKLSDEIESLNDDNKYLAGKVDTLGNELSARFASDANKTKQNTDLIR